MNGLLGGFNSPDQMGLLGLSAALLRAGGPSSTPTSFGQAIGGGLLGGMGAYQQAQTFNQQNQMNQLQGTKLQMDVDAARRSQSAMESFANSLPADQRALFMANPSAYIKAKSDNPFGNIQPNDYTTDSVAKFQQTRNYADLVPVRKNEVVNTGGSTSLVNPYGPAGTVMPNTVSPDTNARLNWDRFQFNNISAPQRANLSLDAAKTYFDTGMNPLGVPSLSPQSPPFAGAPSAMTPRAQADLAARVSLAAAQQVGDAQGKAQVDLPGSLAKANQAISLIDQMIGTKGKKLGPNEKPAAPHPGFEDFVGATWKPGARFVDGTDAAGFQALYEQVKGGAFLQAFESLKGGGQITQIEGDKATAAIMRMQRAQDENEFVKAAREFQDQARKGMELAKARTGQTQRPGAGSNQVRVVDW